MKNLKRALSLVLSTAMVLGMMVVGTGAAFDDVKAEHNEEAIAVIQAAGIMTGDDKGNFNPDANITRNEMAVVMVNMLGLDTDDFAGAASFTDVPAWAADYVDACYANGIVSGVSATQYNGAANVTTAEAALMMLKALGYFEYKGFDNWLLDTIKQASKIDLLDGIDAKATGYLTRNDVAQLALNTLEATCVEETATGSNTEIKGENLEITIDSTVYTSDRTTSKYDYNNSDENSLELIEELFGNDFTKNESGKTKLGLPAIVWDDEDGDVIIRAAKAADEVIIASKEITALDLYKDEIDDDFEDEITNITAQAGDVVYYYENDDNFDAYIVSFELVQITDIDDDMNKGEIKDGHAFEVELNDGEYEIYDDKFAGYDYEEDDYVLVVLNEDEDEVIASELAEVIEGTVTKVKSGKYTINGTAYKNLSDTELEYKDEVVAVLNKAGQIILVDSLNAAVKSEDIAYIYNIKANEGDENEDGVEADGTYTAYVVLADGSKAKYVIEEDTAEDLKIGDVIAYSINKDGEIEAEATDYEIEAAKAVLKNKAGFKSVEIDGVNVYANSKTEFVFAAWNSKDKMVVTTATGIANVNIDGNVVAVYEVEDGKTTATADLIFVLAEDEGLESDTDYAVILDSAYAYTENDDDEAEYTYSVFANGEETELTFQDELDVADGDVIAYFMDGDYAVEDDSDLDEGTVTYEGEGFIEIDGAEFTEADDIEIVTITTVLDAEGEYDYTEADDSGKLKKDAKVLFSANDDDEIEIVFILEIDD